MNVNMSGNPVVGTRQALGIIAFLIVVVALITVLKIILFSADLPFGPVILWFAFKVSCGVFGLSALLYLIFKGAKQIPADYENF